MNTLLRAVSDWLNASGLLAPFLDALLKSFVILILAGGGCFAWQRASAAMRHLVWFAALLSLPCLLLLACLPRSWHRPLWSVSTHFDSGNQVSFALAPARDTAAAISRLETSGAARAMSASITGWEGANGGPPWRARFSMTWVVCGVFVWVGGVLLGSISFFAGQFGLRKISRSARALRSVEWDAVLREASTKLGMRRAVILLESADHPMPVTWGWWRPVILLPREASQWPIERRRVVLLHELAHVKRWDGLTQTVACIICHLFWVNPLVWLAARRMCAERERACDDLVLSGGWKPSEYAGHLVEVARACAITPQSAAIAMARSSQLEGRVAAIVDASRTRQMRPVTAIAVLVVLSGLILSFGGNGPEISSSEEQGSMRLRNEQVAQLEAFAVAKEKQSLELATKAGEKISPEFARFFDAATRGDWETVTNMYASLHNRHPQYDHGTNAPDLTLRTAYWSPVLELCLAYDHVANCAPKYTALFIDGVMNSIPAGSIYFGGTDPGRGIPTAFAKSHADGDPFFTLTQNALADGTYLKYLHDMYGGKIYTPSTEDSEKCFNDYLTDARRRLHHDREFPNEPKQVRPGEELKEVGGQITVSGQVAVMSINALLVKLIFDRNPGREFYLEESFPLEWMYPHLEPHGLIMKINRSPQAELPQTVLGEDHEYWTRLVAGMLGDWPGEGRSIREVADFVEKVYLRHDLAGFTGDARFVQNDYSKRLFSKLRSSIGGVYAWRASQPAAPVTEKDQMTREADLAFRQAFALCPYSPEAAFRYVTLLVQNQRTEDALIIASTSLKFDPKNGQMKSLVEQVSKEHGTGR